jgi:hypothetical protein
MATDVAKISDVPVPPIEDEKDLAEHSLRVSGLAVHLTNNRRSVRLRVQHIGPVSQAAEDADVLLSVPAASRLSRLLDEAVQDYLHGPRRGDQSPEDRK